MTSKIEEARTRIAELEADNRAAPGWGAAVGARQEEINGLHRELRRLEAAAAVSTVEEATALLVAIKSEGRVRLNAAIDTLLTALVTAEVERDAERAKVAEAFQQRVAPWMQECFGPAISADRRERSDRFLEEALELTQAADYTADRAHALVDYVFGRPKGELVQEAGGVMVTLVAFALAHQIDMHEAGEIELARINRPEVILKIRTKQAAKARDIPFSPLPSVDRSLCRRRWSAQMRPEAERPGH